MPNKHPSLSTLIQALEDIKATNIVVLDVNKQTTITDFMIICNGRSSKHAQAIANSIIQVMKKNGMPSLHISGMSSGDWILVDFGDYILHIMQPECRAFYNLEDLWQNSIVSNDKISQL